MESSLRQEPSYAGSVVACSKSGGDQVAPLQFLGYPWAVLSG